MPLKRIKKTLEDLGTANGLLYLLSQSLRRTSGSFASIVRYHFYAQPVPATAHHHTRVSAKNVIREARADDPVVASFPRPASVIAQRFADGATCLVAEHNGQFSGYLWLARNAYEEDEVRCRYELHPPQDCAWDFDVYVVPEYRLGRTFARLWDAANAYLASEGVRWSLSRISSFNPASLAAHRRLGIQYIGSATFLILGNLQISLLPGRALPHLHRARDDRPSIRLTAPKPTALITERS